VTAGAGVAVFISSHWTSETDGSLVGRVSWLIDAIMAANPALAEYKMAGWVAEELRASCVLICASLEPNSASYSVRGCPGRRGF
jgi:hypothetical protein